MSQRIGTIRPHARLVKGRAPPELELPMLLPGIRINTSATDFFPMKQVQLARFDAKSWQLFGEMPNS